MDRFPFRWTVAQEKMAAEGTEVSTPWHLTHGFMIHVDFPCQEHDYADGPFPI
jgi:hypothetical protein